MLTASMLLLLLGKSKRARYTQRDFIFAIFFIVQSLQPEDFCQLCSCSNDGRGFSLLGLPPFRPLHREERLCAASLERGRSAGIQSCAGSPVREEARIAEVATSASSRSLSVGSMEQTNNASDPIQIPVRFRFEGITQTRSSTSVCRPDPRPQLSQLKLETSSSAAAS